MDFMQQVKDFPVRRRQIGIFWLGNASFLLKLSDGTLIAIDPYLSDSVFAHNGWKRLFPPPVAPDRFVVDIVITTHCHLDHFDPETIAGIMHHSKAIILGPGSCIAALEERYPHSGRGYHLPIGGMYESDGVKIESVKAHHQYGRNPAYDAIGGVVQHEGMTLYHSGDTEYKPEVVRDVSRFVPLDVAMLPINGKWSTMSAVDAALYAVDLDPRIVIPMHYGLFYENSGDPYEMLHHLQKQAFPNRVEIMTYGSGLLVESEKGRETNV